MIPLVENNYNFCELGPRGTGKSHIYKEISPNSILVSGGQTTVANLFYNMSARKVGPGGAVGRGRLRRGGRHLFQGQGRRPDHEGLHGLGILRRGREPFNANASMVFVGNINQTVETLVKTSHLLAPFPEAMIDSAFFDRFHAYIPGWEIPKMRPEFFTNQYGLIVDYLAEFMREMRKRNFADAIESISSWATTSISATRSRCGERCPACSSCCTRTASTTRKRCDGAWSTRWRPAAG